MSFLFPKMTEVCTEFGTEQGSGRSLRVGSPREPKEPTKPELCPVTGGSITSCLHYFILLVLAQCQLL